MSSEIIFLPTPNWFISRPVDVNIHDSTIATCAINSILITNSLFSSNQSTIKDAHSKRLHGVSFYNIKDFDFLASCSDDLDIKVWNYKTRALVNQHKLHQNSPSCIDWIRLDPGEPILLSCDLKGNIFKWNVNSNEHVRYFPENKPITQIKTLDDTFKTAVGYKTGTIVLLDVKNEGLNILHKFKNHEDSINCLLWCPGSDEMKHVLASSSEDKTIRVWCTIGNIQLKCLKVPMNGKSVQAKNQINYVPMCWPKPSLILTGSFKGDLHYVDLEDLRGISSNEGSIKWNQFSPLPDGQCHKKIIFDIIHYNEKIVTISLDRLLNTWCLKTFKQEKSMMTLNGFVYSLAPSPIDPNFMAIACGDSSIKFLNEKNIVKSFTNNIKSEVTQISWHPTKESILAFGTKDGKVGIAEVMSNSKPAHYIYTSYNQSVYTLIWCEDLIHNDDEETKKSMNLYSVADGKIIQHCLKSFSKETLTPESVKSFNFYKSLIKSEGQIEYGLTEFSVLRIKESQGYFFCIGKFDGSIEIFKSEEKVVTKLCSFFNHQKLVTYIKWNVDQYSNNFEGPVYLASGSNDFNVILIDFKELVNEVKDSEKSVNFYSKFKHKFTGHTERITGLSWSKTCNLLASCSYDSTVQIWNADSGEPVANYRGHSDKLLCCLFANDGTNSVYSGGEDYCLNKWKIDGQEFKVPPEECPILFGKKKTKLIKKQTFKKPENELSANSELKKDTLRLENEEIDTKTLELTQKSFKIQTQIIKPVTKPTKSQELKTLFTLSSTGNKTPKLKLNDCLCLFETLYEQDKIKNIDLEPFEFDRDNLILNLFCNRLSVLNLIKLEEQELKRLVFDKWWIFDVWRGNLFKLVKHFKETYQLNDLILNLYQLMITCSNESTLDLVNGYIEQLSKESSHESIHRAVLYCCTTYQVEKAIEIYLNNNLYPNALCLAQLRMFTQNEILKKVLVKYALYSTQVGDYETAVLCYIRLGDFENAYKILLRRNTKNDPDFETSIKILLDKFSKYLK